MKKVLFLNILFLTSITAFSAHIVGGEMYYKCLQDNLYEVTMKLYRDCNSDGADFDAPAFFSVFDESDDLVMQKSSYIHSISNIDPNVDSPCISYPPDVCIEEGIYIFQIQLPSNSQAYKIVYQRCCRNATIQNLVNPEVQGLTIVAEIPASNQMECNSRPSFNNFPPPVLCAQEPLYFDHSATDLDGDSLVYSLCSPYLGGTVTDPAPSPASAPPYTTVFWDTDYSAIYPVDGNPGLSIDPVTGLLTGKPTQLGQYVVGVCVEEWRNGQLLSLNTRDFQFNVALCEQTYTAVIGEPDPSDLCGNLFIEFINLSNPENEFVWNFGDPQNPDAGSNEYNPNYNYPDTGTYEVMLITNPGYFCSDTAYLTLPLYDQLQINAGINGFQCLDGIPTFSFMANGIFESDATINWNFGSQATPQTASGVEVQGVQFSNVGDQTIYVEVIDNVCGAQNEFVVEVQPPPETSIILQDQFCSGMHYQFMQESQNVTIYHWVFEENGEVIGESNQANPGFTFPHSGVFTVSLSANDTYNCPVTVFENFEIYPLLAPEIEPHGIYCLNGNSVDFKPIGSFTDEATFEWHFQTANPSYSFEKEPTSISFEAAGNHLVELTVSENGCSRMAEEHVVIHNNPIADFETGKTYGCAPLTVSFVNQSLTQSSSVGYIYDFGDGNQAASGTTSHIYTEPGIYDVSFFIQNLNGCIDSDHVLKQGIIEVVPTPRAGFVLNPEVVSVIDPTFKVVDGSEGSTSCKYTFDDMVFEECSFEHTLINLVRQPIVQVVENEYGCRDRIEKEIIISDHLIYIPNSFTPNEDGINDVFYPVATGAQNISMVIFNRWGQVVYENYNDTEGWNGSSLNREYYSPAGLYPYIITLTDNLGWNFEYKGTVRLLK